MLKQSYLDHMAIGEDFSIENKKDKDKTHLIEGHPQGLKTKVGIFNHDTGECVFMGHNKTMLAGSEFMAMNLFNIPSEKYITPTYNSQLGLQNTVASTTTPDNKYVCQLFCMGTSGCNRESALKYEVVNKWWIQPADIVPFQYVASGQDLNTTKREIYFGRKVISSQNSIAYYFKRFDSEPVLRRQLEDGTAIDNTIYDDKSELTAQVIVTNSLTITKDDGRDFFIATSGINNARFNCIELCLAWYRVLSGYNYYQDIRPCTRINFPNKYLSDTGAAWDIVYQLYF